jgi:hypothetical protein
VEIYGRELFLNEAQCLIMTAERLDHLIGVVKENHLRPDTRKGMGKFSCGALPGVQPALSVR